MKLQLSNQKISKILFDQLLHQPTQLLQIESNHTNPKKTLKGVAAVVKRVIMERDTYNVRWGFGPRAQQKKELIKEGALTEKGKVNEKTPRSWILAQGRYSYLPALGGIFLCFFVGI